MEFESFWRQKTLQGRIYAFRTWRLKEMRGRTLEKTGFLSDQASLGFCLRWIGDDSPKDPDFEASDDWKDLVAVRARTGVVSKAQVENLDMVGKGPLDDWLAWQSHLEKQRKYSSEISPLG